jgi:hypothetical protein
MTDTVTQTWSQSKQDKQDKQEKQDPWHGDNVFHFSSSPLQSTKLSCGSSETLEEFVPRQFELVLLFDSANNASKFVFQDVNFLVFVKTLQSQPYAKKQVAVVPVHRNKNLFNIAVAVNEADDVKKFAVTQDTRIHVLVSFATGMQPAGVVGAHLMVTGDHKFGTVCAAEPKKS